MWFLFSYYMSLRSTVSVLALIHIKYCRAVARKGQGECPHNKSLLLHIVNLRNLLRFWINSGLLLCNSVKADEMVFSHCICYASVATAAYGCLIIILYLKYGSCPLGNGHLYKGVSCIALSRMPFILAYFLFYLSSYLCFPGNFHLSVV